MSMSNDEMGDRMKMYESKATSPQLDPTPPICARLDGRSFSKFTRGCEKPFDYKISNAMRQTTAYLVEQTHAKVGYTQSDEITLIWENIEGGSIIFDGKIHKMTSVLASMATAKFVSLYDSDKLPSFDCRVWQVPNQQEAANTILWRVFDARRNAVSSACRVYFSPTEMYKKNQAQMRQMLLDVGIDFEKEYFSTDRYGSFFQRVRCDKKIEQEVWDRIPETCRPSSRMITRSYVKQINVPFFGDVVNRVGFIFNGETPTTRLEKCK